MAEIEMRCLKFIIYFIITLFSNDISFKIGNWISIFETPDLYNTKICIIAWSNTFQHKKNSCRYWINSSFETKFVYLLNVGIIK